MQVYEILLDHRQRETTPHGSPEFPLAIYTTQISKNILGRVPWHWHEELQFCLVTEGSVVFQINSEMVTLSEGEGLFVNVGQLHQAQNHPDSEGRYFCVDFHPQLISGFPGSLQYSKYVAPWIVPAAPAFCAFSAEVPWHQDLLCKLMRIYDAEDKKAQGYELRIQILLLEIWEILVGDFFAQRIPQAFKAWDPRIQQMMAYLSDHYSEPVKLEEIAAAVSLSKSACCRLFKAHVKRTLFDYLLDHRLMSATRLLLTTEDSISHIAYACGFGSTSYFIEKFRERSGLSPFAYRKQKPL